MPGKDLELIRRIINEGLVDYSSKRFSQVNLKAKLPENLEPAFLRKFFRDVDLDVFWFGSNGYFVSTQFEIIMNEIDYAS